MRHFAIAALLLALSTHAAELKLGAIVFPNSGKPEAQTAFLRGVALMHNFWYAEAAKSFRDAQAADPDFALAYWGEAMTANHPIWLEVSLADGRAALAKLGERHGDERESMYVNAVQALYGNGEKTARDAAYEQAMEKLARAYPDDIEAQVFWALSILGTMRRDEPDARKQIRAAAILEPLYAAHPEHPGVLHYLIHAYDDPIHAPLGLRAARRYSVVAAAAPHALHMPSHIFVQLGMWSDAARANEQAYATSQQWVMREQLTSDKRDLHSLEWLQYAYLQMHRFAEARRLVEEVKAKSGEGDREAHAREHMTIRYSVETGDWSAFEFGSGHDSAPILFARGMQAIARSKLDDARAALALLDDRVAKSDGVDHRRNEVLQAELHASIDAAGGDMKSALRQAAAATSIEESLGAPSGPPDTFKPATEFYGELLLRANEPAEALAQFRASLLRTPNRALSLAGAEKAEAALRASKR